MIDGHLLDPCIRCFLVEEIATDRRLTRNTQHSYRDAIQLLLRYLQEHHGLEPAGVTIDQVSATVIRGFLAHLEDQRGNSVSTRNQRLKAIHALFHFVARRLPELAGHAAEIHAIPPRRLPAPAIAYLEQAEIEALLAAPDRRTAQGERDYALILFLYNTGASTSEVAELTIDAITLDDAPVVRFVGRRATPRVCPLWPHTADVLRRLLGARLDGPGDAPVFRNVRHRPITRFGIHSLVARTAAKAAETTPALQTKRVSPHTIRHTTAVHFLRAGVELDTVCAWLGHVSVETMNRYAQIECPGADTVKAVEATAPHAREIAERPSACWSGGLPATPHALATAARC